MVTGNQWRVQVGPECIGSASCVGVAPEHFELGEDNRSHPREVLVDPDETVLDAAASCPVLAITVVDTATGAALEV